MGFVTFFRAIKPLLLICKIFGMVPFQAVKNTYKVSKLGIAYNVVFLVTYVALFVYVTVYEITNPYKRDLLVHTIYILQNLSGFGVTTVIWVSSVINQKMYIQALNKLSEIDKSLKSLGIWMYYDKIRKVSIILLSVVCTSVLASLLGESKLYIESNKVYSVMVHLLYNISLVNYAVLTVQVYIYLNMLRDRFSILNQHLREIEKYQDEPNISIIESKNFKLTNPLGTKLSLLRLICPLHHELCKAANMFDNIFGINLLVSFGNSFVSITTYMYYMILKLKAFNEDSANEILSIMGTFALNIIFTTCLCWICHATVEEVKNILLLFSVIFNIM